MHPIARLTPFLTALMLVLAPALAQADVVMPPPSDCPEGTTPQTGHHGPYCQPAPPESCPEGHTPKVHRDQAYCEPPADPPCPDGSYWTSSSATHTWCQAGWNAPEGGKCATGYLAVESALCARHVWSGRVGHDVVSGTCKTDADCTGKEETCAKAVRCVPVPRPAPPVKPTPPADPAPTPADEPTPAPAEDDKDEVKAKCSLGDPGATPSAATLFGLATLAGLAMLRRR